MTTKLQRKFIFDKIGYTPSVEQWAVHDSAARVRLVAGGERGGKSFSSAMDLVSRFYEGSLYWLVAADYERTRAEYDYICWALDKLGWKYRATNHIDPGEIEAAGGFRIVTKSARDPRKLAMEAPDGILGCEASQLDYETYLRLRGRIAEKRGWMLLSGTFESSLGWYPELFNRWQVENEDGGQSFSLPSWSNLAIYPGGREDPEIKSLEVLHSYEWFMERCGGIPAPPKGRVLNEFSNTIHTGSGGDFEYDPNLPVYIWVDPGYAHFYAVLAAQKKEDNIYVVDEIYENNLVTDEIVTIAKQRQWWRSVVGGAIDIGGTQHQAMPSVAEAWLKLTGVVLRSQKVRIQDGIEVCKSYLKVNPLTNRPKLYINTKCRGLISEMGGCPNPHNGQTRVYSWRTDRDNNVIGMVPDDRNNDACKALAYGLVDLVGYAPTMARKVSVKFF